MSASWQDVVSGAARWAVVHGRQQDILPLLPAKSIDVACHDPPYSAAVHSRSIRRTYLPDVADQPCRRLRKFEFGFDSITPEEQAALAQETKRIVKRWTLTFSDTETAHSWKAVYEAHELDYVRYCFWIKDRAMPQISGDRPGSRVEQITVVHPKGKKRWNGGGLGNVFQYAVVANCSGHRQDRLHEAQKPEKLLLDLLDKFTDEDDLVLDAYCGSSTTGLACLRLGRRYIGIDRQLKWVELSRERLAAVDQNSTLQARQAKQGVLFG